MTHSNSETTPLSSPNGPDSPSWGLLSALWQWIKSYGGLSDLKKYNASLKTYNEELRKRTLELRKSNAEFLKLEAEKEKLHKQSLEDLRKETESIRRQNARLAELESKLDIVLSSSDSSSMTPQPTDDK
ncbi:MAG: hypothetical protein VKJ27_00720 [Synechocystis sp.]|nr:hypothetical protein [Synechocystis sp.]